MTICNIDTLPEKYEKRNNIVVLSEEQLKKAMQTYETSKFLLNEDICYLIQPYEAAIESHPILQELDNKGLLNAGKLLVQGRENEYFPIEEAMEKSIVNQMQAFLNLCQYLGACSVSYEIIESDCEESKWAVGGSVEGKSDVAGNAKLDTSIQQELTQKIINKMNSQTEFKGGKPDLLKAEVLINSRIFDNNPNLSGFYAIAKNQDNNVKNQTIYISFGQEIAKSLEIFANADIRSDILPASLKVDGRFDKSKISTREVQLKYTVIFPDNGKQ